jgi:hypothetical protein
VRQQGVHQQQQDRLRPHLVLLLKQHLVRQKLPGLRPHLEHHLHLVLPHKLLLVRHKLREMLLKLHQCLLQLVVLK